MSTAHISILLQALREHNGIVIDDNAPCYAEYKLKFVAVYQSKLFGEVLIPLFRNDRFLVNAIEIGEDGRPRITKDQVGNSIDATISEIFDLQSIDEAVTQVIEL